LLWHQSPASGARNMMRDIRRTHLPDPPGITSPIGVPSSACFNTNAIYTSENFEAFIEFSASSQSGS
jgi:hypothetical protein